MKGFASIIVSIAAFGLAACPGKKPPGTDAAADAASDPDTTGAAEPDTAKAPEPDTAKAPEPDTAKAPEPDGAAATDAVPSAPVDYVRVLVAPSDPAGSALTVEFKTFKVIEANIDLAKPETAKAVIEVDAASVATGSAERDAEVKSAKLLDVASFAKLVISADRIKAIADTPDSYEATATLDMHGVKKEVPVRFKVVEKKEGGVIVIEGEAKGLARADWGMSAEGAGATLDVQVRLTLSNVVPAPAPQ